MKKKKRTNGKVLDLDVLLRKLIKLMDEHCDELYLVPEENKKYTDRKYFVNLFDHASIEITDEQLVHIREMLNKDPNDYFSIAKYIGEENTEVVSRILLEISEPIMKAALKKMYTFEQVYLKNNALLEELAYDHIGNVFTTDLDVKEVVRSIMEADNPFCLLTIKKQEFELKGKKWVDVEVTEKPIDEMHYYRTVDPSITTFFKEIGGTEYVSKNKEGLVVKLISTSPSKLERTVRLFEHDLTDYFMKAEWKGSVIPSKP